MIRHAIYAVPALCAVLLFLWRAPGRPPGLLPAVAFLALVAYLCVFEHWHRGEGEC